MKKWNHDSPLFCMIMNHNEISAMENTCSSALRSAGQADGAIFEA
jgi:hypothetical protein